MDGGEDPKFYNCKGWFEHGCRKIIDVDMDKFLSGRTHVTSDDVIMYVCYIDPGICPYVLVSMDNFERSLATVERRIIEGSWGASASISRFTSYAVEFYKKKLHKISSINELVLACKEDIFMSYIARINPDVQVNIPKVPNVIPPSTKANVSNRTELVKLVEECIPYLNMLEQFMLEMTILINQMSSALIHI